jgi:hypothetical protein
MNASSLTPESSKSAYESDGFAPVIDVPPLQNCDQLLGFDRFVLDNLALGGAFVRKCLPFELSEEVFKKLSNEGPDVFVLVVRKVPGVIGKAFSTGCLEDYRNRKVGLIRTHAMGAEFYEPTPTFFPTLN